MSRKKLPVLLAASLLKATTSLAQVAPATPPATPPAAPNEQRVSVPVPRAVSLLADVVGGTGIAQRRPGQSADPAGTAARAE